MADITVDSVNAKLAKSEDLSNEEIEFVKSMPPEGESQSNTNPDEETEEGIVFPEKAGAEVTQEKKTEPPEGETPEEKTARETKEAKDAQDVKDAQVKKDALIVRAKKVNLAEDAKEEDIVAAEKKVAEPTTVDMEKLEKELVKPEGGEDIKDFNTREQAYFWQMRKDRKAKQKAEHDLNAALFREIKLKKGKELEEKPPEEKDPFEGREEEDFITVSDAKKIMAAKKEAPKEADTTPIFDNIRMAFINMCDDRARTAHEDFDVVMELHSEIALPKEEYQKKVAMELFKGGDPVETAYQLIKADPDFLKLKPAAELRVKARQKDEGTKKPPPVGSPEAIAAQAALEKNKDKLKTTAHAGGEGAPGEGSDTIEGYTLTQIINMSDLEFADLPKKTRDIFLEKYG